MTSKPDVARILLIDDHALFRAGLAMLLETGLRDIEIVEAGSINDALLGRFAAPAIVLLDVMLPGLSGLEGLVLVKQKWPQAKVIMLSSQLQPKMVKLALARGATEFISKAEPADKIIALVQQIISADMAAAKVVENGDTKSTKSITPTKSITSSKSITNKTLQNLSPRQCEVLELICHGLSNKMIGARLHISDNTVHWHVRSVLAILQVVNRSEAAFAARKLGMFD